MADKPSQRMAGTEGVSRRRFLVAAGGIGAAGLAGCLGGGNQGDGLSGNISISGSSTVYPVTTAMSEEFSREHPNVNISISRDGTSGGFKNAFIPGESDINNASRPISKSETQQCKDNGFNPLEFRIARDALTIVVNNEADWVDCITIDELKQIWSPDTKPETWADVNSDWPDEPFDLYGAATTSGTFDYFTGAVVGEEGKIREDFQGTEADDQIAQGVSGNEHALGYLPFAYYTNNPDSVKALKVETDGSCVEPTLDTAKSGEYPLARPLFIYVNDEKLREKTHLQEFVRFYIELTSDDQLIAEDIGYVPMGKETVQKNLDKLNQTVES